MSELLLATAFSAEFVAAIERLVDARVQAALEGHDATAGTPWLTLDEGAAYLRVSPRTLDRIVARGRIRTSTIGRRRIVHRAELDAYMRSGDGGGVTPATQPRRRKRTLDVVDREA